MSKVWFSADWHFCHKSILTLGVGRPFATIEEHDEALIERHNALVAPEDTVWVLGDVAMGAIGESLACCKRMNGRKILLLGNHDRPAMVKPDKIVHWRDRYGDEGGFEIIIGVWSTKGVWLIERNTYVELSGQRVAVSHYPYTGESEPGREDRYVDRRPTDVGMWLLHGHVHDQWRVNGRQINVGVDVWNFKPVAAETLAELIVLEEAGRTE